MFWKKIADFTRGVVGAARQGDGRPGHSRTDKGILAFHHTSEVIKAETLLREAGLEVSVKGPPPDLRTGCDLVIEFFLVAQLKISVLLDNARIVPLKVLPLQNLLLEPVSLFHLKDFGNFLMVRAANMKMTIDKTDLRIVNISGGGCPDVPYLADSLVGKTLHEAPPPRSDAWKILDEAMAMAREFKNQVLVARIMNVQGDIHFFRGEYKVARDFYTRALQLASQSTDFEAILTSRLIVMKVAAREGSAAASVASIRKLTQEGDKWRLKRLSIECSLYLANAMMACRDYEQARKELDRALHEARRRQLRTPLARGHYQLATLFRLTGRSSYAREHYQEALRVLDEIRKDSGTDRVLERVDFKPIFAESTRLIQAAKG